jgi:hypothetical protein
MEVINIEEIGNSVGAEKSAPKKTGTALSADWLLPKKWGEWALTERPDLTADDVRKESEKFKDHWRANANQAKAKKADWEATWRNWIRNIKRPSLAMPSAVKQTQRDSYYAEKFGGKNERDITRESAVIEH